MTNTCSASPYVKCYKCICVRVSNVMVCVCIWKMHNRTALWAKKNQTLHLHIKCIKLVKFKSKVFGSTQRMFAQLWTRFKFSNRMCLTLLVVFSSFFCILNFSVSSFISGHIHVIEIKTHCCINLLFGISLSFMNWNFWRNISFITLLQRHWVITTNRVIAYMSRRNSNETIYFHF